MNLPDHTGALKARVAEAPVPAGPGAERGTKSGGNSRLRARETGISRKSPPGYLYYFLPADLFGLKIMPSRRLTSMAGTTA
jgi:hypothetical protein